MRPAVLIKDTRKALGLSQVKLAQLAKVSLPTVQNIEAEKANPSLSILESIFEALGLKANYTVETPDWNLLATLGAPMLVEKEFNVTPTKDSLIKQIQLAAVYFSKRRSDDGNIERKRESIQCLLLGLRNQFPSVFSQVERAPVIRALLPHILTGRHIKLKRIAESRLSQFL